MIITALITQVDDSGHRILQESIGNSCNMEAVFRPEIFRNFPVYSCQFPVLSGRNRTDSIGKNPKNFRPEYCFDKITIIVRNRPFSGRTVRPTNVSAIRNLNNIFLPNFGSSWIELLELSLEMMFLTYLSNIFAAESIKNRLKRVQKLYKT